MSLPLKICSKKKKKKKGNIALIDISAKIP